MMLTTVCYTSHFLNKTFYRNYNVIQSEMRESHQFCSFVNQLLNSIKNMFKLHSIRKCSLRLILPSKSDQNRPSWTTFARLKSGCVKDKVGKSANVYIHWPYCKKRCSYCNFNKYVVDRVDHDRMISCLVREWRTCSQRLNVDSVDTIFFGGGTPSLMRPADIQHIVRQRWEKRTNCPQKRGT